jgi:hypothetical protein
MTFKFEDAYPNSPAYLGLRPLRIPSGWTINWNELNIDHKVESGDFGGSSTFCATNEGRRFIIDVEFRPECDPNGRFILNVIYVPWPRTENGARRKHVPFARGIDDEIVHVFETRSVEELVEHLEHWIARCTVWTREGH